MLPSCLRQTRLSHRLAVLACLLGLLATGTAFGTSYIYQLLKLPAAPEIVAFANGIGEIGDRVLIPRGRILKFLAHGKNNLDVNTWYPLEQRRDFPHARTADGVFTDRSGKVYFWTMNSPKVLKIISAEHEQALLQLGW